MNAVGFDRAEVSALYERYLHRCNEHRFEELGEFVDENVEVNGVALGRRAYAAGLAGVIEAFPDFRWEVQHLLVDGCWLAVHLTDHGTSPDGRTIAIREFAVYRLDTGRIAAVWGDLDPDRLAAALSTDG